MTCFGLHGRIKGWEVLAHVCRRWRSVVFQSPRRLNLRILCTSKTPARDALDLWPPLPLVIYDPRGILEHTRGLDNIVAALEHNDRVCQIQLRFLTSSQLEFVTNLAAMQKPFPELTDLILGVYGTVPIIPHSFLGGTAPRLRSLDLRSVPFPGLPKLLLSATHLVYLELYRIPRCGYIPPDAMATGISALANLEFLCLEFQYPPSLPALGSRRTPPHPPTRSILPSLVKLRYKGTSEYLEETLARIDAHRLNELHITFFNQIIFTTPQLREFINRRPTLREPEICHIAFSYKAVIVKFPSQAFEYGALSVEISCTATDWQLSSLEQVCSSCSPPLSTLQDLYIFEDRPIRLRWQHDVENRLWLDLLHPFAAVKNLYLSEQFVPYIAPALQELVGGRTTEVLPALENIFLEDFLPRWRIHEGIEKFVAARRLTSRPVAVSRWEGNSKPVMYKTY